MIRVAFESFVTDFTVLKCGKGWFHHLRIFLVVYLIGKEVYGYSNFACRQNCCNHTPCVVGPSIVGFFDKSPLGYFQAKTEFDIYF